MVLRTFCAAIFLITSIHLLFSQKFGVSSATLNKDVRERQIHRPNTNERYSRYVNTKVEPFLNDFMMDDDDFVEYSKRQNSDDYGHLRFGRRNGEEISDDYGHMRFGRSGYDQK